MIFTIAKLLALLVLIGYYGVNVAGSDNPLFAFFYQPNFVILLVILFIAGTFFKLLKLVFTLALIGGICYYGYCYYTGESPLNKYATKTVASQKQDNDKCGPNATWYDKLVNQCYSVQMEKAIRE